MLNILKSDKSPYSKRTFESIWQIEKIVLETVNFEEATQKVVNIILEELGYLDLGYQVIVLTLLDQDRRELRRIAISRTESAAKFLSASPIPFQDLIISLDSKDNLLIKSIFDGKPYSTKEVADVLYPALPREWVKSFQEHLGIKTSLVYPIKAKDKTLGALIFSLSKDEGKISQEESSILDSFVGAVGIALDNALLFKSLNETKKKLETANTRLKQLDKLKDDFVSVASHELRTPMTAIKSYIWMGLNKKKNELSPELEKYLVRSYISVERLINLVNDMLNISRIEGGRVALRLSEVSLVALAKEVIEEVIPKAQEKGIKLYVNENQFPTVTCDKDKIHEVYLNLIGNALKFTPKGGEIKIDFKVGGPYLSTSVTDSGVGIAPENMAKLFTKFGRLENSYVAIAESGGTGLGLYISKSLVELHKGKIGASSPGVGRGTTFSITLPIASSQVGKLLEKEAPKETAESKDLEKTNINVI